MAVEQLAQVLGRGLGHAVDVPGDGPHVLGHPRRRALRAAGVSARPKALVVLVKTKDATPADDRLLQEVERARDVGVDEVLPGVRGDVGLVQRRRVDDGVHAPHARAAPGRGR